MKIKFGIRPPSIEISPEVEEWRKKTQRKLEEFTRSPQFKEAFQYAQNKNFKYWMETGLHMESEQFEEVFKEGLENENIK